MCRRSVPQQQLLTEVREVYSVSKSESIVKRVLLLMLTLVAYLVVSGGIGEGESCEESRDDELEHFLSVAPFS